MSQQQYYYALNDEQFGPVAGQVLYELFAASTLHEQSLLWTETLSDWTKLKDTDIGRDIIQELRAKDAVPTKRTQRPKSIKVSAAATSMEITKASSDGEIWIEDDQYVWMKATIIDRKNETYVVRSANGQLFEISSDESKIFRTNKESVPDITSLSYIHEPAVLQNLKDRYASQLPYTYIGSVLIAINPIVSLPVPNMGAYIQDASSKALQSSTNIEPYPYALGETAYQQLNFSNINQSIVISGESGSGKTETAKILLRFLVNRTASGRESVVKYSRRLDSKLLESSPILESFGNAKTCKNNNSSRFGKFMKLMYFAKDASSSVADRLRIIGASINTYLLEKSRVIRQSDGERNYHIFYTLLAGIQNPLSLLPKSVSSRAQKIGAVHPEDFRILNNVERVSADGVDDRKYFEEILNALTTVGFSSEDIEQIMLLLYGILLLGNISFSEVDSSEGAVSSVADMSTVSHLSNIFQVNTEIVISLLTEKKTQTRGEWFTKRLTVADSLFARDAVAKCLYESLFHFIVEGINFNLSVSQLNVMKDSNTPESMKSSAGESWIGVLDIFGFEHFVVNHFEQLLINFANEVIQNTFNSQVFDAELRLYERENLECTVSSIPDNSGCIELISDRSSGILAMLDNISRQPKGSDERFCDDLHKSFNQTNKYFPSVHPKDRKHSFVVHHYAGGVKYTVNANTSSDLGVIDGGSWISKNNDSFPDELSTMCQLSELPLLKRLKLSGIDMSLETAVASKIGKPSPALVSAVKSKATNTLNKPTISALFTKSMRELNTVLQSSSCQFVRCIKPNRFMAPNEFDNQYIVEQLRSLGVLQTCEVLKAGKY